MTNKVILTGNLTKNPELTTTSNGKSVIRFTLAVSRNYKNTNGKVETDFINIVIWNLLAENCNKYLKKGSKCTVVGTIQNRSYEAQDGTKRYITEIVAEEVEFLSTAPKKENEQVEMIEVNDDSLPF